MRISLLLEREPFGRILEETLPRLVSALSGRRHTVRWYEGGRRAGRHDDEQTWLCNFRLNAIFRPAASRASFEPVVREFARSLRWWTRPLQRAYVAAAIRRPTAGWLADGQVGVSPPLENGDSLVILGGNHRLRVVDGPAQVCHVIAKAGTDPTFLQAELALRRSAPDLPIPRLCRVGPTEQWFTEELIPGTPLNRLPLAPERARALEAAHAALGRLIARTLEPVVVTDYLGSLVRWLEGAIAAAPLFAARGASLGRTVHMLASVVERLPGPPSMATAETHGDFQAGNVLVARDAIWLIDWEYTARRQAGFDLLTYGLAARFPVGLAARVREAASGKADRLGEAMHAWPGVDWSTTGARRRALALFLLEELVVRVRENAAPHFRALTPGTPRVLDEIEHAAQGLASLAA